jgi:alginate O-acetyltransferase complex protein AlgI
VFCQLGLLGIFKYGTFTLTNLQAFRVSPPLCRKSRSDRHLVLHLQILSYVIDVYRGEVVAQRSFPHLLMYVSLFHQCIAGPIVRYKDISDEIFNRRSTPSEFSAGVTRFATGLAKKALLANTLRFAYRHHPARNKTAADLTAFNTNAALLAGKPAAMLGSGAGVCVADLY